MMKQNKISKLFDLTGRNIILTGSAGLLGSQYAYTLSEAGANVILVDLNEKENKKLEKKLIRKYKTKAKSYTLDISNKNQVKKFKKEILSKYKIIHGLVNNAAYTTKGARSSAPKTFGSFETLPLEIWQKFIDINLTGPFLLSQEFGSVMAKQRKGVIVNISSTYGLVGTDQRIYGNSGINAPVSYAVTKSGMLNLTRYLAAYWQGKNVRVNTLSPGGVMDKSYQNNTFIQNYSNKTMLGRMARKNEYNGALLFLLSDASSYMTGSNLIVDGGWTAW